MRRVIGGLIYDTERAELIHEDTSVASEPIPPCLYRTPRGRWFTVCAGEAGDKKKIYAVLVEHALAWCERVDMPAERMAELFDLQEA